MASQTSLITGVDFLCVPTADIERSAAFYGGVLGLPELKRWGRMPGVEYQAGNLTLALMRSEAFGQGFRPNSLPIALQVDDVESARAALEAKGVAFHGDLLDSGVCHQAFFSDPDGNPLALHHRYAPKDW
jgi:catechol 2,3-dioxygenase-like lactoylglutathione lyase family enzyme